MEYVELTGSSTFGGVEENDALAEAHCADVLPCTFELRCKQKFLSDEELQEQDSPRHEEAN